ncbi:MAG: DUF1223 domain-containing protein [Hyphomicrobiaceae bacterium]
MFTSTTPRLTKSLLLAAVGLGLAMTSATAQQAFDEVSSDGSGVHAVLELFTSQGCSSCPAADALLGKYAADKNVIALSLPVDYWDYLGWKDTLAKPKFSARQKYYAKERGDGRIYTPQMVVNGRAHVVGSNSESINTAIASTSNAFDATRVPVKITLDRKHLVVETGDAPAGSTVNEATIWLVMVHREAEIKIERGENRGKTVKYINVVRELNPIGVWSGKAASYEISREAVAEPGNEMCVVLLQIGKAGPIIGAASVAGL